MPARVEVAVVDAAVAEMNELNVDVPRSPRMVVEAVRPIEIPSSALKEVDEADLNCWRPVQMLALVRLISKLMVPEVVTGFVPPKVRVEFGVAAVTEVTVPEFE